MVRAMMRESCDTVAAVRRTGGAGAQEDGKIAEQVEAAVPSVPQDLAAAQKAGLVRVPTHIVSVSCPPPICPRSWEGSARHAHLRNISHENPRAQSDLVIVQTICDDRGEGEPDVLLATEHTAIQ